MNIKEIDILGVPAHIVDNDTTIEFIADIINNNEKRKFIVAQNAEKIMMARKDPAMMAILKNASLLIPDGVGISLASKILYRRPVPRVAGFDLFLNLLDLSAVRNIKIFLLGSREEIISKAKNKLLMDYPNLNIVGYHHGYFDNDDEIIKLINNSSPDILFVGMGSPRQEKWIYYNIKMLNVKLCLGIGGSFDVIAGKSKLAPIRIRRLGFEFVYRLIKEPKRLKRQLVFPNFLVSLLATRTGLMKKNK